MPTLQKSIKVAIFRYVLWYTHFWINKCHDILPPYLMKGSLSLISNNNLLFKIVALNLLKICASHSECFKFFLRKLITSISLIFFGNEVHCIEHRLSIFLLTVKVLFKINALKIREFWLSSFFLRAKLFAISTKNKITA